MSFDNVDFQIREAVRMLTAVHEDLLWLYEEASRRRLTDAAKW